ncbi:hypothetical protein [Aquimarina longa]|uniref:hypothetical protein n=1 Tax=Aquimarina longa TaxID=1080221 RepID=UPI000AA52902|nr:hypothetical protein [Aquimarina longa]
MAGILLIENEIGIKIVTTHFSPGSIGNDLTTRFDVINIIVHETLSHGLDHLNQKKYDYHDPKVFWSWEKRAVHKQVNHWSWSKTSSNVKQIIFDVYARKNYVMTKTEQYKYFGKYDIH